MNKKLTTQLISSLFVHDEEQRRISSFAEIDNLELAPRQTSAKRQFLANSSVNKLTRLHKPRTNEHNDIHMLMKCEMFQHKKKVPQRSHWARSEDIYFFVLEDSCNFLHKTPPHTVCSLTHTFSISTRVKKVRRTLTTINFGLTFQGRSEDNFFFA